MNDFYDWQGFQWDKGNIEKNWIKHKVTAQECEQVFFNAPLIILEDDEHSQRESRFYVLGQTDMGRWLMVIITLRGKLIRVISARNMGKKERDVYNEKVKEGS